MFAFGPIARPEAVSESGSRPRVQVRMPTRRSQNIGNLRKPRLTRERALRNTASRRRGWKLTIGSRRQKGPPWSRQVELGTPSTRCSQEAEASPMSKTSSTSDRSGRYKERALAGGVG